MQRTSSLTGPRMPAPPPSSTGVGDTKRRDERDPGRPDWPLAVRRPGADIAGLQEGEKEERARVEVGDAGEGGGEGG